MGFFSDGENDTKTEMVWKENILSVFGFQFMGITVIGASLNCFTIFYLHCGGQGIVVVICDGQLITEYK